MPETPMRGRRGRDRRIAERVATDFAARHAAPAPDDAVDFDIAAVDAEVEDARRAPPSASGRPRRPTTTVARPTSTAAGPAPARKGGGQRIPDLSVLPPLLAATGTFAALRERLGSAGDDPRRTGRHVGLVAVPHGAKSYLAATLALAADGERLVWIARDAEIGDRVAEELGAWLGDPEAVAVLEPRTSLAYERSELIADETAARVAALAAWRSGRARVLVASVQALLQHTIDPTDLPDAPRELRLGARIHQDALLRELFELGYVPVTEVAGRGESARRGGIVDVFPPSMALPIRIEFFGDEIDSLRSFDPTDQRTVGTIESGRAPAGDRVPPAGRWRGRDPRAPGSGRRPPPRATGGRPRAVRCRRPDEPVVPAHAGTADAPTDSRAHSRSATPPRSGPPTSPRRPALDHLDPGTLLVLDEPGDIAEAAEFLWRQADERRAELVEAGELPKDWPSTYLPPRDWKSRLVASRTLELTWESDARPRTSRWPAAALSSGDPFGWREPVLPPGRAGRLVEARRRLARRRRPDRARLGPGAAARRPPRRGRPPGRRSSAGWGRRRRPARSRSSIGASTAASSAARTGSPSSPTASCSGPSGSAGRGPSGGSSRATSSSA